MSSKVAVTQSELERLDRWVKLHKHAPEAAAWMRQRLLDREKAALDRLAAVKGTDPAELLRHAHAAWKEAREAREGWDAEAAAIERIEQAHTHAKK